MKQSTELGWYVIYTRPNAERCVYDELRRRNVTAYMPMQKPATNRGRRNRGETETPLFPNYLFVQLTPNNCWTILDIYGITRYVAFGEGPIELDEQVIQCVQKLEKQYNHTTTSTTSGTCSAMQPGDQVEITAGPLAGRKGVISTFGSQQRARVRVLSTLVDIPFNWLRKQLA